MLVTQRTALCVVVALLAPAALAGCSGGEQQGSTGKAIDVTAGPAPAEMTVVNVTLNDEGPTEGAAAAGDYLHVKFRVDNAEGEGPIELCPPDFAILWRDMPQAADTANADIVIDSGETTTFTYAFPLSPDMTESIRTTEDVQLFYAHDGIEIPEDMSSVRDVQDLRKASDAYGPLSDYWAGELER